MDHAVNNEENIVRFLTLVDYEVLGRENDDFKSETDIANKVFTMQIPEYCLKNFLVCLDDDLLDHSHWKVMHELALVDCPRVLLFVKVVSEIFLYSRL